MLFKIRQIPHCFLQGTVQVQDFQMAQELLLQVDGARGRGYDDQLI